MGLNMRTIRILFTAEGVKSAGKGTDSKGGIQVRRSGH